MVLAEQFKGRVADALTGGEATVDLLPMVFVRAATSVLPVEGAGLSLTDRLRVPLAASDEDVAAAERLQTTIGEGPCLAGAAMGEPTVADLPMMANRWPAFHERFIAETSYQSVASFPLRVVGSSALGALDLYSTSPRTLTDSELTEIDAAVARPIASSLFGEEAADDMDGATGSMWLTRKSVNDRMNIWVAVGMSMARLHLSNSDALAMLRAYAYTHALSLDQLARLMTDEGLEPEALLT